MFAASCVFSRYLRSMDDGTSRGAFRYAHPGHDRIARESLELRQREDELRGRWRELGLQLPQVQYFERWTIAGPF